jgi:hypothetical protein
MDSNTYSGRKVASSAGITAGVFLFGFSSLLVLCLGLTSCGGGGGAASSPPQEVKVSISPKSATVIPGGQTTSFAVSITGTTNKAFTAQVNGIVGGSTEFGTVTTSGFGVTHTSPETIPNPATVSIMVISAADPTKSASAEVTIVRPTTATLLWMQFSNPGILTSVVLDTNENIVTGGISYSNWAAWSLGYDKSGNRRWEMNLNEESDILSGVQAGPTNDTSFFVGQSGPANNTLPLLVGLNDAGDTTTKEFCSAVYGGFSAVAAANNTLLLALRPSGQPPSVIAKPADSPLDCGNQLMMLNDPSARFTGIYGGDSYILIAGDRASGGQWSRNGFVAKSDYAGTIAWLVNFQDILPIEEALIDPEVFAANENGNEYVYVGGTKLRTASKQELYVAKFSSDGQLLWQTSWDGDNSSREQGNWLSAIVPNPKGGAVAVGAIMMLPPNTNLNRSDIGILAVKPDGTISWKRREPVGNSYTSFSNDIAISRESAYVAGVVYFGTTHDTARAFLAKFALP